MEKVYEEMTKVRFATHYRPFRNKDEFLNTYYERTGTKQGDNLPKIFIRTMDDPEIIKWRGYVVSFSNDGLVFDDGSQHSYKELKGWFLFCDKRMKDKTCGILVD